MAYRAEITFNARKIYFFGLLIAVLYGLSPSISVSLFGSTINGLGNFQTMFFISLIAWSFFSFPINYRFLVKLEINEFRLLLITVLCVISYIAVQLAVYGDFKTAFIVAYTERTGVSLSGGFQFIFYPITSAVTVLILLLSVHLYGRRDRINIITASTLVTTVLLFAAIGSRNLLLWSFSGVLALFISRLRFGSIFLLVPALYFFAVLFAYLRNNGFFALLSGDIDHLYTSLSLEYFDPIVHEFGSSFRTFNLLDNSSAMSEIDQAPYGLFTSFILNQLPSFLKPVDFISFTNYISLRFAPPGEGIGSSPMTEIILSQGTSLFALCTIAVIFHWPAYFLRGLPALSFFTYCLVVAISFNIWRIGSAEILKMFASNVVLLMLFGRFCGARVLYFGKPK